MITKVVITDGSGETYARTSRLPSQQLFEQVGLDCCLTRGDFRVEILWIQDYVSGITPKLPEFNFLDCIDVKAMLRCVNCKHYVQIWPIPNSFWGYYLYGGCPCLPFFMPRILVLLIRRIYCNRCCQNSKLKLFFHLSAIFDPEHLRMYFAIQRILEKYPRGI